VDALTCQTSPRRSAGALCLLVLLRNTPAGKEAPGLWDLSCREVRARLERLLSGSIFQAYGSNLPALEGWPYFCTVELRDLGAWAVVQRRLELAAGESGLDWEVVAFGRRTS
jgi:hypothetical protein